MRILLPPSETKRDGGRLDATLDLNALSFARLNPTRRKVLAALRSLCLNRKAASTALGLSAAQLFEIERNRTIRKSAVMPAIDRYTGVLYDALSAESLSVSEREFARRHVVIHSALFGLLGALDPVPAYRLSQDSSLPDLSLRQTWQGEIARELGQRPEFILDLRSESYVALGRAPQGSTYLRVVTSDENGKRRALNHFNKKAKGQFVREMLLAQIDHQNADSLVTWASSRNIQLESGNSGELQLIV